MIAAAALLAIALVGAIFVAMPLLRAPWANEVPGPAPGELRRLELAERRDAAYAALRELELERRTGKLIESDYERARIELRAEAIAALRELELLDAPATPATALG